MNGKEKAPREERPARLYQVGKDRADQSRAQYSRSSEIVQDIQQFGKELHRYRNATPEPRVCVYGILESVPYSMGWR
ncbi:MAG: hypothetical protein JZU70_09620 [Chlorobium sp.]|jgi:hypothetical protein|nr:hypothetical protein [Chlorobium sp.]